MTRRKARLYKHAKNSKQWTEFKGYQRQCKKAFKEAEINHINDECICKMLKDQGLPALKDKRMAVRLTFFYKVVEGLAPAISPDAFLKPQRQKVKFMQKKFKDFETKNIKEIHSIKNSRPFIVKQGNTFFF